MGIDDITFEAASSKQIPRKFLHWAKSPFFGTSQVKILRIENGKAQLVGEAQVGPWTQGVAFAPDGRRIFVGTMGERNIHVFTLAEDGKLSESAPPIAVAGGSASLKVSDKPR